MYSFQGDMDIFGGISVDGVLVRVTRDKSPAATYALEGEMTA